MAELTLDHLCGALGVAVERAEQWLTPLNETFDRFGIDTTDRRAGFLAQVGHESGSLRLLVENLNYSSAALVRVFGKYFTEATAQDYNRSPERIANRVYANRMGNGDEASGDGWRFRGRGLIQITGKTNYERCGAAIDLDLLTAPEGLEQPRNAALSAGWFWDANGLNALADTKNMQGMTRKINGGLNGLDERTSLYQRALDALSG